MDDSNMGETSSDATKDTSFSNGKTIKDNAASIFRMLSNLIVSTVEKTKSATVNSYDIIKEKSTPVYEVIVSTAERAKISTANSYDLLKEKTSECVIILKKASTDLKDVITRQSSKIAETSEDVIELGAEK